jgi:hypothetical protein
MLVEQSGQGQRSRAQMHLGGAHGGADLHRVRAANVAATRATTGVGDQSGDVRPHGREVLDDLFAGLDRMHGSPAVRTAAQSNLDVIVDLRRFGSKSRWVTGFSSRCLMLVRRLAIFVFATEGGRLPSCGAFQFFDTFLKWFDELMKLLVLRAKAGDLGFEFAYALIPRIGVHALLPTPQCQAVSLTVCAMDTDRASKKVLYKISRTAR